MRIQTAHRSVILALAAAAGLVAAGCSSGGGASSTSTSTQFTVENISVTQGATWKINRPIDIRFSKDVDFSTVSLNTINIKDTTGVPATGAFSLPNPRTVRFQPSCPKLGDFSDAGLRPGGVTYTLHVLGTSSGGVTVRATNGDSITLGKSVSFATPTGNDPLNLFLDTVPGPPTVRVFGLGDTTPDTSTRIETFDANGDLVSTPFTWNVGVQRGELPVGFEVPINQYSVLQSRLSVIVEVNQPVVPSALNINNQKITLEYQTAIPNSWETIVSSVELIENCTVTGAALRITPVGLLPQGSNLRVNLKQGFQDLTQDGTLLDTVNFATMKSFVFTDGGGAADTAADEVLEPFALAGDAAGSIEDTAAVLETPQADWGSGKLQASFDFGGTGGPGGDFDWHIQSGNNLFLRTDADSITGGPGGAPTTTQAVINGVVDVRNFRIMPNASLTIIGPKTCTILASGEVDIRGDIFVRGGNSDGVGTLNTTNQPEPGAPGNAGGGNGGTGSFLTTQSTPRGGSGFGAFQLPNAGGRGGESSYHPAQKIHRRGAGGGGGVFGPDVYYEYPAGAGSMVRCQTMIGMDVEPGFYGGPEGTGAESQSERAVGGNIGPKPFLDSNPNNNFLGSMIRITNAQDVALSGAAPLEELIVGELNKVFAGAGGGAGGDAVRSSSFPLVPFTITGDEKGSGGGGGGGGIRILAVGAITITNDEFMSGVNTGRIDADGGHGGGGENTNFFDRVGGGSGGGSGGHIVLSSAEKISIGGYARDSARWYTDDDSLAVHKKRILTALGGQGGAGSTNKGGANETGDTRWDCDAIPIPYFQGLMNPPFDNTCFQILPDLADPLGPIVGAGGDGSPGIIQLHVDDPSTQIVMPEVADLPPAMGGGTTYGVDLDVTFGCSPPPLGWRHPDSIPGSTFDVPVDRVIPFFGSHSTSQSDWIALGLARVNPILPQPTSGPLHDTPDPIEFRFGGVDVDGNVMQVDSTVDLIDPIIDMVALGPGFATLASDDVMVIDGSLLTGADEIYKRNVELMQRFIIKIEDGSSEASFTVQATSYDEGLDEVSLTAPAAAESMQDFVNGLGGAPLVSVIPQFFEVSTNNITGSFPAGTSITITFDATTADASGEPSENTFSSTNAGNFATDIDDIVGATPPDITAEGWDFFRFRVEFDLGDTENALTTPRPALEFLRVPWEF